jgi:predicted TIM-barrel fold metal-dependent hydrolase
METVNDAHLHIRPFPVRADEDVIRADALDAEKLSGFMDARNIGKAFVHLLYEDNSILSVPSSPRLRFSFLADFRKPDAEAVIEKAGSSGYRGIKLLNFEQKIVSADYGRVLAVAREAERLGMITTICATCGGLGMYDYDPLRLAVHLLKNGIKSPIVLAHGGGARVREATLLLDAAKNVYLDTSFTSTYWKGSIVIRELRDAIERFPDRIMFGSDYPAVAYETALADAKALVDGLQDAFQEAYFRGNAENLIFL